MRNTIIDWDADKMVGILSFSWNIASRSSLTVAESLRNISFHSLVLNYRSRAPTTATDTITSLPRLQWLVIMHDIADDLVFEILWARLLRLEVLEFAIVINKLGGLCYLNVSHGIL